MKQWLVSTFLGLCALSTSAQHHVFSIGLELGPGLCTLPGNNGKLDLVREPKRLPQLGIHAGLPFQVHFNEHLSLYASPGYERKGEAIRGTRIDNQGNLVDDFEAGWKLDYLTLPLLLRYAAGQKVKVFVQGGPYASLLLKETDWLRYDHLSDTRTWNSTSDYAKWDAGIAAGLGVLWPISESSSITLELRHERGLSDVYGGNKYGQDFSYFLDVIPVAEDIKTQAYYLLLGIQWGFKEKVR